MRYVLGFLAGALWGVLGACLNNAVLGRALRGGRDRAVLGANLLRALVDLLLLAVIVLARGALPIGRTRYRASAAFMGGSPQESRGSRTICAPCPEPA